MARTRSSSSGELRAGGDATAEDHARALDLEVDAIASPITAITLILQRVLVRIEHPETPHAPAAPGAPSGRNDESGAGTVARMISS